MGTTMASVIQGTMLPPAHNVGRQSTSAVDTNSFSSRPDLNSLKGAQVLPTVSSIHATGGQQSNKPTNWLRHSMNGGIGVVPRQSHATLTPPSSPPSGSSTTSSPIGYNAQAIYPAASYFSSSRPRSQSLAVPAPTSTCPNCGLRRPSLSADQTILSSVTQENVISANHPHLPPHLHCPDSCPDDVYPAKAPISPVTPPHKRYHHRRRSSLCYTESLVDDADVIDSGGIPADVKAGWERQAGIIARRVVLKGLEDGNARILEEAIIDE